jgi:hypothetical protein
MQKAEEERRYFSTTIDKGAEADIISGLEAWHRREVELVDHDEIW